MSTSVDAAFVKQFEREVHQAFQRMGSKLRNFARTVGNVVGSEAIFQKVGKGTASTKSKHGLVPLMNLDHTPVTVTLQDYYAGDWVDRLDELKINIDERQVVANAGAYALGRKTDELIIAALAQAGGGQTIGAGSNVGLTIGKVMDGLAMLGEADVPDDGDRCAVVGWKQWAELLGIEEFANSQYIGPTELPFGGTSLQAKKWLGTTWIPHSGLPVDADDLRSCFWFHKTAVAHASGSDVKADISWHGDRAAHFVNNMMSQGAGLIDAEGVVIIVCDETPDA
jgi:hypothetical protein